MIALLGAKAAGWAALKGFYAQQAANLAGLDKTMSGAVAEFLASGMKSTVAAGQAAIEPIPLDTDHIGVCKPASRLETVHILVRRFVDENLSRSAGLAGETASLRDQYDVFVSHSSAQKDWVEALARNLQAANKSVFLDLWRLVPGREWKEGLRAGLAACRAAILVVSPEAAVFLGRAGRVQRSRPVAVAGQNPSTIRAERDSPDRQSISKPAAPERADFRYCRHHSRPISRRGGGCHEHGVCAAFGTLHIGLPVRARGKHVCSV